MSEASESIAFSGTVDDKGHVKPDAVNVTRGKLAKWKGRRVTVTVTRYVKPKTQPQLGVYFAPAGILDCWAEYMGEDREQAHKDLKHEWLRPLLEDTDRSRASRITGEEYEDLPSLRDVTAEQMSKFLDRVIREGAQRGIEFNLEPANNFK